MIYTTMRRTFTAILLGAATLATGSCGVLDVSDPTAIEDEDLNNAASANLLRLAALGDLSRAMSGQATSSGLLTDEFLRNLSPSYQEAGLLSEEELLDRRDGSTYERLAASSGGGTYVSWQGLRRTAAIALARLRAHGGADVREAYMGQMLAARGFAALFLGETICSGLPLHDVVDSKPVYGPPLSTDEVLERALADFDSAVEYATDSASILRFAQVGRGRTLLALGRFVEAGAAVANVPTDYVYNAEYPSGVYNYLGHFEYIDYSVADQEGGTGLDFVSAGDPRVATNLWGTAYDGVTSMYSIVAKYPSPDLVSPIVVASGLEARLIEAEAALNGGGDWLGILNALRTDGTQTDGEWNPGSGGVAGLGPLANPGASEAQVDLLFRERAFWLFATGHRIGDLRRLVGRYGRSSESVFPTGPYWQGGGAYGTAISIPYSAATETPYNPAVTGCTDQ